MARKAYNPNLVTILDSNVDYNWDFVTEWFPNYGSSDLIGHESDLMKLIENDFDDDSNAADLLRNEYCNDVNHPQLKYDYLRICAEVMALAIENYMSTRHTIRRNE